MKRTCEQCDKTIRSNSNRAVFLFLRDTPRGTSEVWVCGKGCLHDYNHRDDLPQEEPDAR